MMLEGPIFEPPSGVVKKIVIMLHGYGADGNDLIELAPLFAQTLPDTLFISPHAPQHCEISPTGFQWFSLASHDEDFLHEGARDAAPDLSELIDILVKDYKLSYNDVALLGFSQGTMLSLYTALRLDQPIACIVGYSGALIGSELLDQELKSKPPVLLVHGDADPVVPFDSMAHAEAALKANNIEVKSHACQGLQHGIDEQGLVLGNAFLRQYLINA